MKTSTARIRISRSFFTSPLTRPTFFYELPTQAYPSGGGVSGGMQWLGTPGHMINTAAGTVDSYVPPDYAVGDL